MTSHAMAYKYAAINLIRLGWLGMANVERFVANFVEQDYRPDRWGAPPKTTDHFSQGEMVATLSSASSPDCWMTRTKAPRWTGGISSDCIYIRFKDGVAASFWPGLFGWADRLAEHVRPAFGVCHLCVPGEDDPNTALDPNANEAGVLQPARLRKHGLPWLGARTYLSATVAERIGVDLLSRVADRVVTQTWGVVVDLVTDPWAAPPAAFAARQAAAMAVLKGTGQFADYTISALPTPAPAWAYPAG